MPIPKPKKDEKREEFMARCMADTVMVQDYPNAGQRYAVCSVTFATNPPPQDNEQNQKQGRTA